MPQCMSLRKQVSTMMKDGRLFADTTSGLVEVVSVNSAELARLPYDLVEGIYVVGTGSTGAAASLGICGELSPPHLFRYDEGRPPLCTYAELSLLQFS